MPTARSEIAGAVLNDKIYIIGRFDNAGRSTSTMEVYDTVTGKWTKETSLPQPLDHAAATSFDVKLYVVGGGYLNRDTLLDKLYIYDPNTNNWTEGASLPTPRGALTANFINGILYVTGGVDYENTLASTLAYNPSLDQWIEKAPMPTAREHLTSAVVNDKLYVIGGRTNGMASNVNANEAYDPVTDKWIILEPMPSKRGGFCCNSSKWVDLCLWRRTTNSTFSNNEKFDVVSNAWTSEMGMPTARHGLVAAAITDMIYVIGGGPQPGGSSSSLTEIFNTSKG